MPRHLLDIDAAVANTKIHSPGADGERERIAEALRISKDNKVLAARIAGLHRSTLYEKIKKYGL